MIRNAKAGDVQMALLIAETISFEVQMDTEHAHEGQRTTSGDEGNDDFEFM